MGQLQDTKDLNNETMEDTQDPLQSAKMFASQRDDQLFQAEINRQTEHLRVIRNKSLKVQASSRGSIGGVRDSRSSFNLGKSTD